ncbi:Uncharacterized protein Fot_11157 [Forsythia ovata]|uniref:Uncharacterized protein n=1 Tax=Forsythia ovata TaxID=205694 RepID=A0ABD1WIW9_9LAMI
MDTTVGLCQFNPNSYHLNRQVQKAVSFVQTESEWDFLLFQKFYSTLSWRLADFFQKFYYQGIFLKKQRSHVVDPFNSHALLESHKAGVSTPSLSGPEKGKRKT